MPVEARVTVEIPVASPCFVAGERPLFAWHHPPPPDLRRGAGIVLCPALGYEYMSAYRTWRLLAERLAALGFDTLRFDYDGTGDSAGGPEDADRLAAWLGSIGRAIAELRTRSGAKRIGIVGLRAGALLAMQAAADRGDVERLALWSPFPSGRAYVRELRTVARLSSLDDTPDATAGPEINAEGHLFSQDTVEALESWTFDRIVARPATEVLIVERDDRPGGMAIGDRLRAAGSRVTTMRTGGTAEMLMPPHVAKVPQHVIDAIAAWFDGWQPSSAAPPSASTHDQSSGADVVVSACGDGFCEWPVRFGPGDRLFGILARRMDRSSTAPSIILFNTGAGHHVGPHRLYVPLARQWAADGHVVLRFDLDGIGDSGPASRQLLKSCGNAYPSGMLDDARHAIAFVRQAAPGRRVIVAGLCSGGWLAFQAARHGLEVDAIVAINPPLYLRDADQQWRAEGRELARYQQSMRNPSKWAKAVRGDASYATFTRLAARSLARKVTLRVRGALGEPPPDSLAGDLCTIADRGITSFFVFSRGDDGLAYYNLHARPVLGRANVRDAVQHVVVEDAGHAFRPRAAQQLLRSLLTDVVTSRTRDSR